MRSELLLAEGRDIWGVCARACRGCRERTIDSLDNVSGD